MAFAKHLFNEARMTAETAPPANASALLSLQDAVELFVLVGADVLGIPLKPKASFEEQLNAVEGAIKPGPFTQRAGLTRLNNARVGLKHHGNFPAADDLVGHVNAAQAFLLENCRSIFGVEFSEISMTLFVHPQEARALLDSALVKAAAGDMNGARLDVAASFARVLVQFHDLQPSEGVRTADIEYCVSFVVEASIRLAGGFPTTAES